MQIKIHQTIRMPIRMSHTIHQLVRSILQIQTLYHSLVDRAVFSVKSAWGINIFWAKKGL